jgi:hypothetical protein
MKKATTQYFICVDNEGYEASLERRKLYGAKRDERAMKLGLLRIIDESGQDYLYPKESFVAVALPAEVRRAVSRAA